MHKRRLDIFLLLTLFTLNIFSQADSLKLELRKDPHDTVKIKIFEGLSFCLNRTDIRSAEAYRDSARLLAEKINIPRYYGFAELAEANIAFVKSLNRLAINHYLKSNYFFGKTEPVITGTNYSSMAFCYYNIGQPDSFYYYCIRSIKLLEEYKAYVKLTPTYANMAYILTKLKKYEEAKKYFKLSNEMALKQNSLRIISRNMQNTGILYEALMQYDSALYCYKEALKLKQKLGDSLAMGTSYSGMATIYRLKGQFNLFLLNENKFIEISRRMKNEGYVANGYYNLGEGFYDFKQYDSAISYFNRSLAILKTTGDIYGVSDCYMFLAESYNAKGEYKKAFEHQKLYKATYDSAFSKEKSEQLENLKIGFETEKKDQENQALQKENDLSVKTIKQQKIITYFIIGGLVLAVAFAFFIFRGLKQQRKANRIISKQKTEVERQKELVDEKQKEILDSIYYARRIQRSLLTSEKYIARHLSKLQKP